MPVFTQILVCINFLLLVRLPFYKCFGAFVDDKFTFLKTISKNEEGNVYHIFSVPSKSDHILTCSATCVVNEECIGIDICDKRICRLWNATFYPSLLSNNSKELCYRYIKMNEIPEFTSNVLGYIYRTTTTTSTKSGLIDSITTDEISNKISGNTDSIATDVLTTKSYSPNDTTTSNVALTETTTCTIFQTTTEAPTTIDSTIITASTSEIVSLIDTSISDVQTTAFPSTPIDSATIMITTESSDETCIMTHEFSGGIYREVPCYNDTYSWIIIQRRYDGSVDFYRNWNEYKLGFGSLDSEFWLGNSYIHELTSVFGYTHLRIEIKTFYGQEGYAEYSFSVDDEASQYIIHIAWISGNIGDSLWNTDGALFCTLDRDNDGSKTKVCTTDYHGGWWYTWNAWCTEANPNGFYYPTYKSERTGIFWFNLDEYFTLKEMRLMVRKP